MEEIGDDGHLYSPTTVDESMIKQVSTFLFNRNSKIKVKDDNLKKQYQNCIRILIRKKQNEMKPKLKLLLRFLYIHNLAEQQS